MGGYFAPWNTVMLIPHTRDGNYGVVRTASIAVADVAPEDACANPRNQTASKFSFRWWGVNPTLSGKHQLHRPLGPHSTEEEALGALESRV
jgi:hypothetical protein